MAIGILTLHLSLPECASLKDKRSKIKPYLARLHREFNVSAAEIDFQDQWHKANIACSIISNNSIHNQQVLQKIIAFSEIHFAEQQILKQSIESI